MTWVELVREEAHDMRQFIDPDGTAHKRTKKEHITLRGRGRTPLDE